MTCEAAQTLLDAYVDGELDANRAAELAEHLAACPSCAAELRHLISLGTAVKENASYYHAPPALAERIRSSLRRTGEPQPKIFRPYWQWTALAACLLLAVSFGFNLFMLRTRPQTPVRDMTVEQAISSHIRALVGNRLVDVPSSDRHTVKPWFNGKTNFSPAVKDLSSQGFPLLGGRLDYVSNRTVATLVYERRKHVIDVFVWPADSRDTNNLPEQTVNGYHVIRWTKDGMAHCAVSDLNPAELRSFKQLVSE
jgi:anti-sigma factor RsiW